MMNRNTTNGQIIVLTLILVLISFEVIAQQNIRPEQMYGTWVFNESLSINRMDADLQQELQGSPELQQLVNTYFSGKQMVLASDGTFQISFVNGLVLQGQWAIQGNQLVTQTNGAGQSKQRILFSGANNLCLLAEKYANPEAKLLFKEAHYTKN